MYKERDLIHETILHVSYVQQPAPVAGLLQALLINSEQKILQMSFSLELS